MSFGQIPGANQLQLGPLGADGVLSTPVQPLHDSNIGERTGGETSHTTSGEHCRGSEIDMTMSAHVLNYEVEEGEEKRKKEREGGIRRKICTTK